VSNFPTHFAILKFASIDFQTFKNNQERISKSVVSGEIQHVYFFHNIPVSTGKIEASEEIILPLNTQVKNQVLSTDRISSRSRLQISELSLDSALLNRREP
jgi:hypothetical protein